MAIQVSRAEKKDISAITGIFRNPPVDFRSRNIETNILHDISWSVKRLASQSRSKAGGIFVAKDNGALVGFGMPVTYNVQIMDNESMRWMQAAFAGNQEFHGGEKAAIASYRACYERADFVMFLPHETKDAAAIYRLLLESIVASAREMHGIRTISGAMPKEHGKIAVSLGMLETKNAGIYEITFEGKKIRLRKITLYSSSVGHPSRSEDEYGCLGIMPSRANGGPNV
jgi:hypothetical protein